MDNICLASMADTVALGGNGNGLVFDSKARPSCDWAVQYLACQTNFQMSDPRRF